MNRRFFLLAALTAPAHAVPVPRQFVSGDPGFIAPILTDPMRQVYYVQGPSDA
jgi:hypothetical protein